MFPLLALGFLAMLTSGCEKDDSSSGYYFKCKIDGVAFEVTKHLSDGNGSYANIGGDQVNAQNQKKSSINIGIVDLSTKGAAVYTPTSNTDVYFKDESDVTWQYKSGSFTVTKYSADKSEVTGTFSSIVVASSAGLTKTFTDGSFNVYLIH